MGVCLQCGTGERVNALRLESLTSSESMPVFCLATMAGFRDAMRDVTAICRRTPEAVIPFMLSHKFI